MNKTIKRTLTLLLALCLILPISAVVPAQAEGAEKTAQLSVEYPLYHSDMNVNEGSRTYMVNSDGTANDLQTTMSSLYAAGTTNITYAAYGNGDGSANRPYMANNFVHNGKTAFPYQGLMYWGVVGDWVAFRFKSPGEGKFNIQLNQYCNSNNTKNCDVYILSGDTASNEIGAAIDSAKAQASVNLKQDVATLDLGEKEFSKDQEYVIVFEATEAGSVSNARMHIIGLTMTKVETDTLTDALSAATTAFHTVKLTADTTVDTVAIDAGVTLDLNGNTLTASSVNAAAAGAQVIDSTDGTGILTVAKDSLSANGDNGGYLPLYDSTGYRFYKVAMNSIDADTSVENTAKLRFQVKFNNTAAYALILKGTTGVSIKGTFGGSVESTGTFTYADGTDFAAAWAKAANEKAGKVAIVVNLSGLDAVDTLTLTPSVYNAGVSIFGTALTAKG